MKTLALIAIILILSSSANAFSVIINEPVTIVSTPIQYYFSPLSQNPFGDIRDIFLGQTISGQFHNTSQFYPTQISFGYYNEVCDSNGELLQVFNTLQYPLTNYFPQAPASAGIVSISANDLVSWGINPPPGHSFSCFTPPLQYTSAFMAALPFGFTANPNLNLGIGFTQSPNNITYINSCINPTGQAPTYIFQVFDVPSFNLLSSTTCFPNSGWCCLHPNQTNGMQLNQNQIVQVSLCDSNGGCDVKMMIG